MGKVVIYQMLPRLWGEGRLSCIDEACFAYLKTLGVSHIWYTGIIRHSTALPFVKGTPGSPYAISDYYDVNPYLADAEDSRMAEFEDLVKRTHDAGMKVIIDFVPNHVGRDYGRERCRTDIAYLGDHDDVSQHWTASNDFFYYPGQPFIMPAPGTFDENPAKATGNCFTPAPSADDWYDTVKINYCDFHTSTWDKMLDILMFWASKGVDGFRCDMVELVPPQFFTWAISRVKERFGDLIFIAEAYNKDTYASYIREVGFDYLYDKSGFYDTIRAIMAGQVPASRLSGDWQWLGDLQPHMLNFLENHDEQRFASPHFGGMASNTAAPLYMSAAFNTSAFMIYFGEEIGEAAADTGDGRTSIFNFTDIPALRRLYAYIHTGTGLEEGEAAILRLFRAAMAFAVMDGDTYDLGYCNGGSFDRNRHFAFLRRQPSGTSMVFLNFSPSASEADVVIPQHAAELWGITCGTVHVCAGPFGATVTKID